MYRVLIVDDDRIIRRGLVTTIPWEEHGFKLVGEAGDGEQALELIDAVQPQIVVSDIRMPFMDGLAMAEQIKKSHPDIRFIFLTGYEDFNYAKEALKLGAVDYLLKPVNREVILEKVRKAAADWEAAHAAQPYFRRAFFQKLLQEELDAAALYHEAETLGLQLQGSSCVVMLVKLDAYKKDSKPELKDQAAAAVIEKERDGAGGGFLLAEDTLAVLRCSDEAPEQLFHAAQSLAAKLCQQAKEQLQTTFTIAIGQAGAGGLQGVRSSWQSAMAVLEFRHVIGKDKVISVEDLDTLVHEVQSAPVAVSGSELAEKVRMGLVDDAQQLLSEVEIMLRSSRLSLIQVRLMAVDILLALFKGAQDWAREWSQQYQERRAMYYEQINQMQTVEEILVLLRSLVDSLGQFMTTENENQRGDVIDTVTDYIEAHYAEHGLSLQDIGEHVHMNPIYLSVLFKKKKNITFTGFLLQVRMKKAMEMLRCRDLKNYEVAEQTGYSSPEYFCSCFKKYTGVSPAEFRSRG